MTMYNAWEENGLMDQIDETIKNLGWESTDNIVVEVGGTSVYEIDGAGTRWAPVKGTRKYNKDAFIVIKRKTPVISSNAHPPVPEQ
tara:strand:- start:967 stop:1224 length:258 start_codon:yes stop_codon:yes gene_type:complete